MLASHPLKNSFQGHTWFVGQSGVEGCWGTLSYQTDRLTVVHISEYDKNMRILVE